ncbi:hypothetical protein RUM44_002131 [Polyplax serrata]|uniref:Uncharacterized protein n=1 Tax=Polyplax serrata TaxID=468196 RepID=A0ABR1AM00_POLSC
MSARVPVPQCDKREVRQKPLIVVNLLNSFKAVKGVAAEIEEMKVVLKVVVPVAESWKTKERGQGEETKRNAGREKDHNSNSINNTVRNFLKWTPTPSCDGLGYHWYLRGTSRSLRQTRKINTA